jgi:putative transposase
MSKLTHSRTCIYNIGYHIIWSTKYRKPVLVDEVMVSLKNILNEIAVDKDFIIETMEIMPDHVHLFVKAHPKIAPSYIFKMLKGISARKLLLKHSIIKEKLWNNHLWNPSTYIETIGHISQETIIRYIEDQKKK